MPVQHVRFDGEPTLEVAGVDALAFMRAAGPDAIRVVTNSNPTGPLVLQIGDLPDGYEVIVEPIREPIGTIRASIGVGEAENIEGHYVAVGLSNPLVTSAAYNTTLTAVDINGHPGWVGYESGHYVIWEPVTGTFATAGGTNSTTESVALARSIRFVDRETWQAFYNVDDPEF